MTTNPAIAVVWVAGLAGLAAMPRVRLLASARDRLRCLDGHLDRVGESRTSHLAPSYTLILPAGGIALGRIFREKIRNCALAPSADPK